MSRKKKVRRQERKHRNGRSVRFANNKAQLKDAFQWFQAELDFADFGFHGNTSWRPFDLILLALVWSLSDKGTLTESFAYAKAQVRQLGKAVALSTYQGMLGALVTWTDEFLVQLKIQFHGLLQRIGGGHFRVGRWVPLAMDGSRATTPRTKSNEEEFSAKNYGKGATAKYRKSQKKGEKKKHRKNETKLTPPQMWVTLIWHIGLGVPWDWRLGPSTDNERDHVKDMLEKSHFVKNTIFVGDAGFVGYQLWRAMIQKELHFLVRVGANVHLLTQLGYTVEKQKKKKRHGLVYCWPNDKMRQQLPPLILRLVKCKIGKANVWLLTNVLDEEKLTTKETKELYERRWGVELEFRSLKQVFDRRRMRSRNSQRSYVEMHWSIMAMTLTELFAIREQLKHSPRKMKPANLSFAKALRAIRRALDFPDNLPIEFAGFSRELQDAVLDGYERTRCKKSRYRPKRKHPPSCGAPNVRKAGKKHRQALAKLALSQAL